MAEKYRVRETDADGRPVTGVGPDHAGPGAILPGPLPEWLIEQGYVELVPAKDAKKKGDSDAVRPE